MHFQITNRFAIFVIAAISIGIFLPAIFLGIPENYDLGQHMRFAITYHESFRQGEPFPTNGWADNFGFGSVGVRFYPPLAHVAMGLVQFLTNSWYDTLWLTMLFWMFTGLIGVYLLATEFMPKGWALIAAIAYVAVPYHLLQIFQAFFLSEFAAAAIIPFCFLFLLRVLNRPDVTSAAMLGFFFALLVLAHLPSAIMGSLAMAVFTVSYYLTVPGRFYRRLGMLTLAAVTALLASSGYWVRMLSELQWVKHNTTEFYAAGYYNYATYFFPMFLSAGEDYFPRFLWMLDLTTAATLLLLIPAIIAVFKMRLASLEPAFKATLAVAVFAAFMASLASKPIWDAVPLLQKLQFPFRWLSILSFAAAILFPAALGKLIPEAGHLTRWNAYPIAAITLIVLIFDITQIVVPSAPVPRDEIAKRVHEVRNTAGCECWWPIWARKEAFNERDPVSAGGREWAIVANDPDRREYEIAGGPATRVRFNLFYYPRWFATVNGNESVISPDANGAITLDVPEKPSRIVLEFREPAAVFIAQRVSLVMLFILPLFAVAPTLWRRTGQPTAAG